MITGGGLAKLALYSFNSLRCLFANSSLRKAIRVLFRRPNSTTTKMDSGSLFSSIILFVGGDLSSTVSRDVVRFIFYDPFLVICTLARNIPRFCGTISSIRNSRDLRVNTFLRTGASPVAQEAAPHILMEKRNYRDETRMHN